MQAKLETVVNEWGNGDDDEEAEEGAAKKGLSDKKKNKLYDARTWERDGRPHDRRRRTTP